MHPVQQQILEVLDRLQAQRHGNPVPDQEIASDMGLDVQSVRNHIRELGKACYLEIWEAQGDRVHAQLTSTGHEMAKDPDYVPPGARPAVHVSNIQTDGGDYAEGDIRK